MGIAGRGDDVEAVGTVLEGLDDFVGVEHFVADGVVDLVEDDQVVFAAVDGVAAGLPTFLRQLDVCRVGFGAADFDEAAAHWADFKLVIAEHFGGVELAVVPRALDELHHQYAQALAHGAERGAECASGLAFARPGVNDEQSFFFCHDESTLRVSSLCDERIRVCGVWRQTPSCYGNFNVSCNRLPSYSASLAL